MKKLVLVHRSLSKFLDDSENILNSSMEGKVDINAPSTYVIGFDEKKDFDFCVKNIDILMAIYNLKPSSVYELAKLMGRDQSNLNKVIKFFEYHGVIEVEIKKINNRNVKRPIVDYKKIEFDLSVA